MRIFGNSKLLSSVALGCFLFAPVIAGFLAQAYASLNASADPLSTTLAALYVGGLAGDLAAHDLGMRTMVASDIRDYFGAAIQLPFKYGSWCHVQGSSK